MSKALQKKLCLFLRSQDGTAIIEFGLLAPAFLFMLLGAMQVCILLVIQNALDMAAYQAGQFSQTGYTGSAGSQTSNITQIITTAAKNYSMNIINTNNLIINTAVYSSLASVSTKASGSSNYGVAGQVTQYQISYTWPTLFSTFSSSGNVTLVGNAIVINEIIK